MEASPVRPQETRTLEASDGLPSASPIEAEPRLPERTAPEKPKGALATASARIDALTGLRFFLALIVMLSHIGAPPVGGPWLHSFFDSGYAGVTVFFVLSGFVLTHNYYERFASGFDLRQIRSFLAARIARVYPLYLLLLLWVALPELGRGEAQPSLLFEHALGLQAWEGTADRAYAFNGPGWSVSVEIFMYCCFPLLMLTLSPVLRSRRAVAITAGILIFVLAAVVAWFHASIWSQLEWRDPRSAYRWLYRLPLSRLGDFTLGILGARLLALGALSRNQASWLIGISAAAIIGLMSWPSHYFSTPSWDLSYAVPAAVLIVGLAGSPLPLATRFLSTPGLLLLGESSYALYLCHRELLPKLSPAGMPQSAWFFDKGFVILLIVALSVGLHIVVERPARGLVRRWLDARPARARRGEGVGAPTLGPRLGFSTLTVTLALAALMPVALLGFRLADGQPREVVTFDQLIRQAAVLIDRRQPSESLEVIARAERMNPKAFAVHLNRCVANGMLEQKDAAVAACRQAVDLEPGSTLARNNLAWVERLAPHGGR